MSREIGESVKDLQDLLKEEEDEIKVKTPSKEKEKEKEEDLEEEDLQNLEGEEDKEIQEEEDDEEKKAASSQIIEIPNYKEIVKKYPEFFKDFPHLRHIVFHEKEYREIFPTVDDAKEAIERLEDFDTLRESLSSGTPEDIINVIDSIKGLGDEVISKFSTNFLSSVRKIDQDLYYQVITPEIVNFTRSMFNAGLRNENDNLKNAALVAAQHFFGNQKIASGEQDVKLPIKETKKDDSIERERQSFKQERYTTFYNDVVIDSNHRMSSLIANGLDPKNNLSDGMKEVIIEKVQKEIDKILGDDSIHKSRMNSLWKKANGDNFSTLHKSKIISAYLEAAKEIMPRIRSKVKSSILGIRDRSPETSANENSNGKRRTEPPNNIGGGRRSSSERDLDPKKIDYKKTSDMDIIQGKITYKN